MKELLGCIRRLDWKGLMITPRGARAYGSRPRSVPDSPERRAAGIRSYRYEAAAGCGMLPCAPVLPGLCSSPHAGHIRGCFPGDSRYDRFAAERNGTRSGGIQRGSGAVRPCHAGDIGTGTDPKRTVPGIRSGNAFRRSGSFLPNHRLCILPACRSAGLGYYFF